MEVEKLFNDAIILYKRFPIMVCDLPTEIVEEIKECVTICDRLKDHRLACLLNHKNPGNSSFQANVPRSWFLGSFLFPYLITAGQQYFYKTGSTSKKKVGIQNLDSSSFRYGVWLNYAFKGDYNNLHDHPSNIVGVIYVENTLEEPTFFEDGFEFHGKPGQMIVFPGIYKHGVTLKKTEQRRLTIAFNLVTGI